MPITNYDKKYVVYNPWSMNDDDCIIQYSHSLLYL